MTPEAIKNDNELGLPLVEVDKIYLDAEFNCRGAFSPMDCTELARNIARKGLQQPVVVRPLREHDESLLISKGLTHKMIAGHRRLTAYKINEWNVIPAIVKDANINEFDARDINAVENLQRSELNLLQESNAIKHYWRANWSREDIADRVGKSPGWVQIRIMLLAMPEEIQVAAGQGYIKGTDVRELNKYRNPSEQLRMAGIIHDKRKSGENRNVTDHIRKKDTPDSKKHRKRGQIFEMIELVQDAMREHQTINGLTSDKIITVGGNSFATRAMAWCAGEITTLQFHSALHEFCSIVGVDYTVPSFTEEMPDD